MLTFDLALSSHLFSDSWCRAVEGDDWSAVIDGQTAETLADSNTNGAEAPQHPAATPFARASVHRSIGARSSSAATVALCRAACLAAMAGS